MAILEIRNLRASYSGFMALRGVSLEINEGEIVGLCGPNKAGKSTLCNCLAGVKAPDAGEIILCGTDITRLPPARRLALGISLCPEGRGIYPGMSVLDNLNLGCDGMSRRQQTSRIEQVLGYFPRLSERLKQQAGTLSGGEAQMLGIARKLLRHPRVIIVDEPSLGLAPMAVESVFRALMRVRDESGTSVLVVEEALPRLGDWTNRVYVLHLGELAAEGPPEEVATLPEVAAVFTGRATVP